MKTRIVNKKMHGNYTDAFIDENYNNIVNGVLVSQWELVEEYSGINGSQIVVQSWDNGNFYTVIN